IHVREHAAQNFRGLQGSALRRATSPQRGPANRALPRSPCRFLKCVHRFLISNSGWRIMTTVSAIQKLNLFESAPGRPINMVICLVVTDLVTLLISVALSLACKLAVNGHLNLAGYFRLWPFLFVFIAVYALAGLYSGVSLSPPEELRRATLSSTL